MDNQHVPSEERALENQLAGFEHAHVLFIFVWFAPGRETPTAIISENPNITKVLRDSGWTLSGESWTSGNRVGYLMIKPFITNMSLEER